MAKRDQLIGAARDLILERGFTAATVDRVCERSGVTKGAFFHYFADKEALAEAVAGSFAMDLVASYGSAPFREIADPLARIDAYIDHTIDVCRGPLLSDGCLIGALTVEMSATQPEVRALCAMTFEGWAKDLEALLEEAKTAHRGAKHESGPLARLFLATVEGALILARAHGDPGLVTEALETFRGYVHLLFERKSKRRDGDAGSPARR